MKTLEPGLYEQLVNKDISQAIANIDQSLRTTEKLDESTSSLVLSQYIESIVRSALEKAGSKDKQVALINAIIHLLTQKSGFEFSGNLITEDKETLLEIKSKAESITKEKLRPATSLTHSYLFTGDTDMPLVNELKREIATADRIDMLVSFLKVSGISMIRDQLKKFTNRGGKLRIISTTYMGATDLKAVTELCTLPGTEIKISYDTKHTRLHAKSYIFYRNTGFNTAYVGSSNLSGAAITDGREWNVKITSHDQSDVFNQMQMTFDIYWRSDAFTTFKIEDEDKLRDSL
ncbi:MAG: phospholipase D-like domain-containing protein, partial [Bullifex sp.]